MEQGVVSLTDPTALVVVGLVIVILGWTFRRLLKRQVRQSRSGGPSLAIDLPALPATGPPDAGPQLELYHVPVRVAVLVLAPAGRSGQLPEAIPTARLAENLLPGLGAVLDSHHTLIQSWPGQVSSQGFTQAFFASLSLPGDEGKGSVWSAVAGRFKAANQPFLAGLVLRAATPNAIGCAVVKHDAEWLDLLRVRES